MLDGIALTETIKTKKCSLIKQQRKKQLWLEGQAETQLPIGAFTQ
jgi:hypothetical protein